jgi:hypothetical protein
VVSRELFGLISSTRRKGHRASGSASSVTSSIDLP